MSLASTVEVVMVNNYSKFGLNPIDSIEVIEVWKNFNLGLQRQRRRQGDSISSHFLRKVELKSNFEKGLLTFNVKHIKSFYLL